MACAGVPAYRESWAVLPAGSRDRTSIVRDQGAKAPGAENIMKI